MDDNLLHELSPGGSMVDSVRADLKTPSVYCIVLNWNGWKDTIQCLHSLERQHYPRLKIIVVDNGSTDESVSKIACCFPSIRLIRSETNLGFAGGNNIGIRLALDEGADYVWLLNSDTVVPPDTVDKLVTKALEEPAAGEIGSVFYEMDAPARVQAWGGAILSPRRFYRPELVMAHREFGANSALMAASVLLRRETLLQVGLLDAGFFMDYEDADLSFRIRKAGWTLTVAENTEILHKGGASFATANVRRLRFTTASRIRFIQKHSRWSWLMKWIFCSLLLVNKVRKMDWAAFTTVCGGIQDARRMPKVSKASL